jgi:nucleotide-binding universal stress UspA family protein
MFKTIVVATDLSKASDVAIGCLRGLRVLGAEKMILIHALGLRHLEDMAPYLASLAEPRLAEQKAALEQQGFSTTVEIASGSPMFEVNRLAKERGASLIAVSSHGASFAKEVLLGGVAQAILHNATVPVLLVRLKVVEEQSVRHCEAACRDFTRHVLYATDFSETADRAFCYVEEIVKSGAKHVTLLHVQDKTSISQHLEERLEEFNKIDQKRLERLKASLSGLGATDVRIEIPYGSPIQEIVKCASLEDDTLVVMGSQGRGFISELFLGSVSHAVARLSDAPVLLIPALR